MANPRLPIPGQDDGTWGEILNEFLLVAHAEDGTLKLDTPAAGTVDEAYVADAIQGKANSVDLALVATSGSYADLTSKPTLSTVAATGSYADLTNKPSVVLTDDSRLANTRTPTDDTVSTAKLQDDSVTEPKLAISNTPDAGDVLSWDGNALAWEASESAPISTATQAALNAKANIADLASVATSNSYLDLEDRPSLATVAATGSYSNLSDTPVLAPVATSGVYNDLTGRPSLALVATTGAYVSLSGRPTLATVATSGSYTDLSNRPTLPSAGTGAANYAAGNDARITGALQSSTVTTKGDLLVAAGGASLNRLGVGADNEVLTADAAQPNGVKWAALPASSGGITRSIVSVSSDMTASAAPNTDYVYILTGNHLLTLPTAIGNTNMYTIKNRHSSALAVALFGSQTADGGALALGENESVNLFSDGANWVVT